MGEGRERENKRKREGGERGRRWGWERERDCRGWGGGGGEHAGQQRVPNCQSPEHVGQSERHTQKTRRRATMFSSRAMYSIAPT